MDRQCRLFVPSSNGDILSFKVEGKTIGVLRFISSLKETNRRIKNIAMVLLAVGGMVILISGMVSFSS